MIDHVWSVLCANCIIDRDSNNLCLIDTIEQFNLPLDVKFPVMIANPLTLVSLWSRSDLEKGAKGRAIIMIHDPTGTSRELAEYEIDLTAHRRFRGRSAFQGIGFKVPGKYLFEIILTNDGRQETKKSVASIPLEIRVTDPEKPD